MDYKRRHVEERIVELFKYYPVVAVLGARQVGKTTLVENLFKDQVKSDPPAHKTGPNLQVTPVLLKSVVFDPVVDIGNARSDPDFFLQNISTPAFLDEIQYAPELLNSIKRRVDRDKKNGQYILSGSQNLSVLKDISESLAGRVAIVNLLAMTRSEIIEADHLTFLHRWLNMDIADAAQLPQSKPQQVFPLIFRGGYPKIMELPDHLVAGYFESYLQTYIERDVRKVSNIGSLQTFGNFIGLLAAHSAGEINHNQLGRDLGIDRKTALAWTEIALATFQWFVIPPFSRNPIKKIAGKPKGYFADTGFMCYLQRISGAEVIQRHPMQGRLFETYVALEILKKIQAMPIKPNLYHFRSYSGAEIDLIMELDGVLYPIEIKMKSNPTKKDIRSFDALKKYFPKEKFHSGLVICSIESPQMIANNVLAVPWWML